jgi:hypothetical protein
MLPFWRIDAGVKREAGENPARSRHCEAGDLFQEATVRPGWEGGTVDTRKSGDLPEDLARYILRGKGYG